MLISGAAVFGILALAHALLSGSVSELITLPFRDISFLAAIIYQGAACSVLAFFLSNIAIEKIGVNRTSSFIGLSTAVSIAAGILILGESFNMIQFLGVILIVAGVYIANGKAA